MLENGAPTPVLAHKDGHSVGDNLSWLGSLDNDCLVLFPLSNVLYRFFWLSNFLVVFYM